MQERLIKRGIKHSLWNIKKKRKERGKKDLKLKVFMKDAFHQRRAAAFIVYKKKEIKHNTFLWAYHFFLSG